MFSTVFVFDRNGNLIWTLSADRQNKENPEENVWVPPGGEIDLPPNIKRYEAIDFVGEALREVMEEIGVKAVLMPQYRNPAPFNVEFVYGAYDTYETQIKYTGETSDCKPSDCEKCSASEVCKLKTVYRNGAHALILQYEALITEGTPRPMKEHEEPESETVEIMTLSLEESLKRIELGTLKTRPAVANGLHALQYNKHVHEQY